MVAVPLQRALASLAGGDKALKVGDELLCDLLELDLRRRDSFATINGDSESALLTLCFRARLCFERPELLLARRGVDSNVLEAPVLCPLP